MLTIDRRWSNDFRLERKYTLADPTTSRAVQCQTEKLVSELMISDTLFFSTHLLLLLAIITQKMFDKRKLLVSASYTLLALVFKPCSIQSVPYNNNTLEYIGEKSKQ